jgi:hypothetical protein
MELEVTHPKTQLSRHGRPGGGQGRPRGPQSSEGGPVLPHVRSRGAGAAALIAMEHTAALCAKRNAGRRARLTRGSAYTRAGGLAIPNHAGSDGLGRALAVVTRHERARPLRVCQPNRSKGACEPTLSARPAPENSRPGTEARSSV